MSDVAIRVRGLSKQYRIRPRERYKLLSDRLNALLAAPLRPFGFGRDGRSGNPQSAIRSPETIWALKDVSFDVKPGEVVGIIGRNGAGKSTLLKILSRITEPTEGVVDIYGRVGSLLEVGTGFHPELTGRENIYLNGAILGMKKAEIDRKFDEIVAFAEVEKFIDTPVKHYSSGMYVRLAFAVAAHLEPEILLVDEVLAVGDAAFQKKCLGKMGDVAKEGRTVLFVSHNMGVINLLCQRTFCLHEGKIVLDGPAEIVTKKYLSEHIKAQAEWRRHELPSDDSFSFHYICTKNTNGEVADGFDADEPIVVEINYQVNQPLSGCQVGVCIYNAEGVVVLTTTDSDKEGQDSKPRNPGKNIARFTIPAHFLPPGTYWLLVAAHAPYRRSYEVIEHAVAFEVSQRGWLGAIDGRLGVISPLLYWEEAQL